MGRLLVLRLGKGWASLFGLSMLSTGLPGRRKRGTLRRQDVGMVGLPAPQTAGAVEDGELAVWILVHPHLGSDEVGAGRMGRDLQPFSLPGDRIVGCNG